jgi:hypothetical protein
MVSQLLMIWLVLNDVGRSWEEKNAVNAVA